MLVSNTYFKSVHYQFLCSMSTVFKLVGKSLLKTASVVGKQGHGHSSQPFQWLLSSHSACELMHFSKETRLRDQASSEQADAQSRPQVSREMLPVHCHAWTCLSIITLECTSPAKRFPPKTVNEKGFLSTQSLTFVLTKNQSDYSMVLYKS